MLVSDLSFPGDAHMSVFLPYWKLRKGVSMIRKYHTYTLQTNSRQLEEETQNIYSYNTSVRQYYQSNQLSLPLQDDFKTRMDNIMHNNTNTNAELPQTMGIEVH